MRSLVIVALALLSALGAGCRRTEQGLPLGDSRGNCGACHTEQAEAFERSAHAHSAESPVLAALLPEVERAWGASAAEACSSCHAPQHAQQGEHPDESVTCISCHAAVGNRAERDGRLVLDTGLGVAGPFEGPEAGEAHATRPSTFLASPSLCGTCHEVTGPGLFVEPTWTEHQASAAFAEGEHCMDCHMPAREDGPAGGLRDRPRRDHAFVGVDPPWGASSSERQSASEATVALLRAALSLEVRSDGDALTIEVANLSRAHSVPTGIAMLRELVVEVTWLDARGGVLEQSVAMVLHDQPTLAGSPTALPTDADDIEVHRLGAEETRRIRSVLVAGAVSARVQLAFRAFRQDVLDALRLDARGDEVPTLTVHEVEVPAAR